MYYDMSDYNSIVEYGSIIHEATDQTIIIVYSPMMLRRKGKNRKHFYKGFLYLNCYPIELFKEYMVEYEKVRELLDYGADLHNLDIILTPLFNALATTFSYRWYFCYQRGKFEYFEFREKRNYWDRKASPNILDRGEDESEWSAKKNWVPLTPSQKMATIKNNRFIKKLISEYTLVRLSED